MGKRNNRRKNKRKPPRRRAASPAKLAAPARRPVRLRPLSWQGEPAEDQAVFDDQALANLGPERTAEVLAVRESLQLVSNTADDAARERLSGIPRRSPLSDWRILVRGLTDWYADRFDEAAEIWRRLDPQRRPSRIARALLTARRKDVLELSPSEHEPSLDEDILAAARRVRKTWFDRPALDDASRSIGFATPAPPRADMPPMHLSGSQLDGLLEFSRKYRDVEPALVADLQAAALERAFQQPYDDVFTRAQKALNGPAHDPANLLLRFHYFRQFSDEEDTCEIALKQFLSISLPQNQHLSAELAAALRSCIGLVQVRRLQAESSATNLFGDSRPTPGEAEKLEALFHDALQAYPANPRAHRAYVDWIRDWLKQLYADKEQQQRLEAKLRAAMEHWSESLPEEIEPRLWLVDEYLEEESLELAEPHVQWLAQSRHVDPRVRSIPWKWEMLEAMRLSRRKTWLSQAAEILDAAETQWPSWLSKTWLPYLRAALTLRSGKRDDFEQQRAEIFEANQQQQPSVSPLADAAMMLAAAQRMRVPSADLKPLRAPVDAALDDIANLSLEELVSAGSFFWDLHRIQLLYPAYRMHAKKFADALKKRLKARKKFAPDEPQQPLWDALFWISERHDWNDGRTLPMPACLSRCADDARYAAATAHHLLGLRNNIPIDDLACVAEILRAATASEQDVYYRYWYDSMAQRLEQEVASLRREEERYRSNPFFNFAFGDWDDDDDDDDDDWDDDDWEEDDEENFDRTCPCEHCTAMRERLGIPHPDSPSSSDEGEEGESDEGGDWFESFFTGPRRAKPTEIPPDPEILRTRPKNPLAKKRKKKKR